MKENTIMGAIGNLELNLEWELSTVLGRDYHPTLLIRWSVFNIGA